MRKKCRLMAKITRRASSEVLGYHVRMLGCPCLMLGTWLVLTSSRAAIPLGLRFRPVPVSLAPMSLALVCAEQVDV
jgi:hypothetical protein